MYGIPVPNNLRNVFRITKIIKQQIYNIKINDLIINGTGNLNAQPSSHNSEKKFLYFYSINEKK